jgi:hypothetical protein
MCKCGRWTWATRSTCQTCHAAAPKWSKHWCKELPKQTWPYNGSAYAPRSADGQQPTQSAPLSSGTVQPKGRRGQAKARARAGTAATSVPSPSIVEVDDDAEVGVGDAGSVEAVEPSIAALEAELKHFQCAPTTDTSPAPIILAKSAHIQRRKDSQRSSKVGWQQDRDLTRKIQRARLQVEKFASRGVELASEMSLLQLEAERVCASGREVEAILRDALESLQCLVDKQSARRESARDAVDEDDDGYGAVGQVDLHVEAEVPCSIAPTCEADGAPWAAAPRAPIARPPRVAPWAHASGRRGTSPGGRSRSSRGRGAGGDSDSDEMSDGASRVPPSQKSARARVAAGARAVAAAPGRAVAASADLGVHLRG